jgi:hypothetical protein
MELVSKAAKIIIIIITIIILPSMSLFHLEKEKPISITTG